jgi:hypothetical protein
LSLWIAGGAAVLLILVLALAIFRSGLGRVVGAVVGVGLIGVAVVATFTLIGRSDRAEERRALDRRLSELAAGAMAPGSSLACLDAGIGETVEGACEKAVFAGPETVAAATAFMNARLNLLVDGLDFAYRGDPAYENALAGLRRAIEADRFGLVAQVLASRDGCTPAKCDAFQWLRDATRIRANLNEHTFESVVARNASSWPTRGRGGSPMVAAPTATSPITHMTFPPAASIPPVSVTNSEPAAPASPPPAAAPAPAAPPAAAAAPPRRPPQPRTAQPRTSPAPPVQLGPATQNGGTQSRTQQP